MARSPLEYLIDILHFQFFLDFVTLNLKGFSNWYPKPHNSSCLVGCLNGNVIISIWLIRLSSKRDQTADCRHTYQHNDSPIRIIRRLLFYWDFNVINMPLSFINCWRWNTTINISMFRNTNDILKMLMSFYNDLYSNPNSLHVDFIILYCRCELNNRPK